MKKILITISILVLTPHLFFAELIDTKNGNLLDKINGNHNKKTENTITVPNPNNEQNPESTVDEHKNNIQTDILTFFNQDTLHGSLLSLSYTDGINYKLKEAEKNTIFSCEDIKEITLTRIHRLAPLTKYYNKIILTNGDILYCNIIELNQKNLIIDTSYAERLTIDRRVVQELHIFSNKDKKYYHGPNSLEEWTIPRQNYPNNNWKYKDGYIYTNSCDGCIGADLNIPDNAMITFTIESKQKLNLHCRICSDKISRHSPSYYDIYLSGYISINKNYNNKSSKLGNCKCHQLNKPGKHVITILKKKKEHLFILICDNKIIKKISDTSPTPTGNNIVFCSDSDIPVRISNIKIDKWNGKNVKEKMDSHNNIIDNDLIICRSEEKKFGEVLTIKNGIITYKQNKKCQTISISKTYKVILNKAQQIFIKQMKNDIIAIFRTGEHITMQLVKIANEEIIGHSENFKDAKFCLAAFDKIILNPYDKRQKKEKRNLLNW